MPETVLVNSRFPAAILRPIAERYRLVELDAGEPKAMLAEADRRTIRAILTGGGRRIDGDLMAKLPALGAIVCYGAGYDGVDLEAAHARGLVVANSPGANASTVADLALGLLLATMRKLVLADTHVRSGDWGRRVASPLGSPAMGMKGCRIGLYGMGEIGRKIAARAAAFETEVGYFSRRRHSDLPYAFFDSLGALADWSDVLIVAVRAGAETVHAVDAAILDRLGPDGFIVNIARGSVIDQDALLRALVGGRIAGAGLDVFANEPQPADALTAHPNIVLSPHIGGHTLEAHAAMQACALANLDAFFAGRPMPYPVRTGPASS